MTLSQKIKCFLGLHDWEYNKVIWNLRVCLKCKKEEKAYRCSASDMIIWRGIQK